jgi:hypothetical protein
MVYNKTEYSRNKKGHMLRQQRWLNKDEEKNKIKQKEYHKTKYHTDVKFREKSLFCSIRWQTNNPLRFWAGRTLLNHKRRKKPLLITRQELEEMALKTKECWLCGGNLEYCCPKGDKNFHYNSASLDVKDISKPLNKNNLQIICAHCNICKGMKTIKEFIEYCKLIAKRN